MRPRHGRPGLRNDMEYEVNEDELFNTMENIQERNRAIVSFGEIRTEFVSLPNNEDRQRQWDAFIRPLRSLTVTPELLFHRMALELETLKKRARHRSVAAYGGGLSAGYGNQGGFQGGGFQPLYAAVYSGDLSAGYGNPGGGFRPPDSPAAAAAWNGSYGSMTADHGFQVRGFQGGGFHLPLPQQGGYTSAGSAAGLGILGGFSEWPFCNSPAGVQPEAQGGGKNPNAFKFGQRSFLKDLEMRIKHNSEVGLIESIFKDLPFDKRFIY